MNWVSGALPFVNKGAKPPADAGRPVTLLWPVWIVPCDLDERVVATRGLDLFEEAVLDLARIGIREAREAGPALGLHRELVAHIQLILVSERLLNESGTLTTTGEAFLARQADERGHVRRTTAYLVLDAVTGEPLPRILDRVEPSEPPRRAFEVRPAGAYSNEPPECSSRALFEAVRQARASSDVVGDVVAVHPSARGERHYLLTYAYQRSLDARGAGRAPGWTVDDDVCVSDPFGIVLRSDRQTQALRDSAAAGGWGRAIRDRLAPAADGETAREEYQALLATKRAALATRYAVLGSHPRLLHEFATASAGADIGALGGALINLANVIDNILRELAVRWDCEEARARMPEDKSALELHIQQALDVCGLDTEVPSRTLGAVLGGARGSVRRSFVEALCAAADDERHPLRALVRHDAPDGASRWLLDLDMLARGRNDAGHESDAPVAEILARVPFQRFVQMTEQAVELLLPECAEVHA